ncbi:Theileria-specific hypothetical protein family member, putative [Theileria annulata]|uniref:Uncharacterized protein n=1 Tax=Theileria annulata TaxID=5874 RepID=Q4UDA5_THEAN|nr:Theileria-specific hypothetical protein family member, putative [Theileria annulata]CAI74934.1 Theileria-specific hypothetical protein family member, putative [Theileria annulata]|eukprot:XP_952666.1 Theileria-specific hypothetical protein family member, putative [Theileria annulata]
MSEDQEISSFLIDSYVLESNSNVPNSNQALTITAQNLSIIGQSNSRLLNPFRGSTIIPQNATIFAKQIDIGTNLKFSFRIHSSNDPEVNETIENFMNEVAIDAIDRFINKPDRSDGIPDDVLDYLRSKGIKNRKSIISNDIAYSYFKKNRYINEYVHEPEKNVQLISVNIDDIPLDKVDVVYGDNYTTLNVKKGFGISKLTDGGKTIWKSNESSKCAKQVLLYNKGDKYYAFLLLNDMKLVSLERTRWLKIWKRKTAPNKFKIKHLYAIKYNDCGASIFEFVTEFVGHFLIIFMPFPSKRITYNQSLVFEYNGNYPLFLSVDLLTCQIKTHLCQNKTKHYLAQFQLGHELSDLEKRGEEDIPVLENTGELISIHETKEMDEGNSSEKLTNELSDGYTKSPTTKNSNSDGSLTPENQQKFDSESANNCDTEGIKIQIVEVNINERDPEYYFRIADGNSRYYRANENVLFDKVIDGKKVIWKKKKNGLLAKEVYFYFDDNVKWVIILLDNNTLKFYHKPSDGEEWTDVSTKMISTDILKVINKNSGKQSRMDLNFDFFSSFCLIDLGNAVSVGYKDYVQYFKEFGIEHSVWLLFDILTKSVHFMEFILETQNQLTNQH